MQLRASSIAMASVVRADEAATNLASPFIKQPFSSRSTQAVAPTVAPGLKAPSTWTVKSEAAMAGVIGKFFLASVLMWIIPGAVLYGFNHNVFPGSSDLSHSLTLGSGLLAVTSVNAVIGFYIYLAMKEPSDKHEPDPAFLAQARASVEKPIQSTEGPSQPREKDE